MASHEPFPYDFGDVLWQLYSSAKRELTAYGNNVAENFASWIITYYLICGIIYLMIFFNKNWSSTHIEDSKRALFVIAHPDDECMFFGPTIVHFLRQGIDVHLLCLSDGDYDGHGEVRREELWRSCSLLGISASHVTLLRSALHPDGPDTWPTAPLAPLILQHVEALAVDTLVTFDRDGVSGHPNHCSIFNAAAHLCIAEKLPNYCRLMTLDSVNILRKYWGYLDLPLSFLLASYRFVLPFRERRIVVEAMMEHKSQLVWFRRLYLIFSRFLLINTLKEVTPVDLDLEFQLDD